VRFADASTDTADVVIGADGIHSTVRNAVTEPSHPVFSNTVAYRGLVPRRLLTDWSPDGFEVWMGPGRHFLTFPVRHGELINFVGFVPADDEMKESWSAPGDPDQLRAEFDGWDPRLAELLSHVERTNRWGLYDREPLERWSSGRVTLLGDAAHPMLPHVGQGANQAIEDGALLGALLRGVPTTDIEQALLSYEQLRRPRTSAVQDGSRRNGRRYDSEEEFTDVEARDADLQASKDFRHWLYDYDVLAELS
jgi:salicylate hydroxylase